jgi:hypothetical protein
MATRAFQRTREDFTCAQCGQHVRGNGYTNHCPRCLWSRHVDIHPGDRAAACRGLMAPIGVGQKGAGYVITHRCTACGFERRNKAASADDFEALLRVVRGLLPPGEVSW